MSISASKIFQNVGLDADRVSAVISTRAREFCAVQLQWTGTTPNGPWVFEGSVNYDPQQPATAVWSTFTLAITPTSPTGVAAGSVLIDFTGVPFPFIRVTFDRTAGGSGDKLNGWVDGKGA